MKASVGASVEVASVQAFMEASMEVASVEASVEVASVGAFKEVSVEVAASVEACINFHESFHGRKFTSTKASVKSIEFHEGFRGNFRGSCFRGSFHGSFRGSCCFRGNFHERLCGSLLPSWKLPWKLLS